MLRFGAGLAGAVVVGLIVFRASMLFPGHPAFECLTAGGLAAGMLTLVRVGRRSHALLLALAFGLLRFALAREIPLGSATAGLLLGLGLFVVALIFDLLARGGWRFGKFLLVGPLVGGVYLALAPITEAAQMNVLNAATLLVFRMALGMLIGEGVALGVELAELPIVRRQALVAPDSPPPPAVSPEGKGLSSEGDAY